MSIDPEANTLREVVRAKYADRARQVTDGAQPTGSACCSSRTRCDPVTSDLYANDEAAMVPEDALQASLGCGNPTALASLAPGEVVLDLGSGGGIDVLLSARRVGPSGFAYGLDMTDEMLSLARKNAAEQGADNVEFLRGEIEEIPLPASTVDVVISNCVINLSADKGRVLREAFRVLRPGGRFAVSDVIRQGEMPADLRRSIEAWVGCVAGALDEGEYRRLLTEAGFEGIQFEVTRVYRPRQLGDCGGAAWDEQAVARVEDAGGRMVSAFVRARRPR